MTGLAEGYTKEYMASLKAYPKKYATLEADIAEYKYLLRKGLPSQLMQKLDDAIEHLQSAGYFKQRLMTGNQAPNFRLNSCEGKTIDLSTALQESPVVLSFFRGRWCGYDTRELQYLQKFHTQIKEQGARLIAISPALPENLQLAQQEYNLSFDLLNDQGNQVADQFGIAYPTPDIVLSAYEAGGIYIDKENGDNSFRIPLPCTFIINQQSEIIFDFYHPDYTVRLEPADIVKFLQNNQK